MPDEKFTLVTRIARPAAEVFAWHERAGALQRLCPPWEHVEVRTSAGIREGAKAVIRSKVGPFWTEWEVRHGDDVAERQFRDVQVKGPFAKWEHRHAVESDGREACRLTDEVTYRLPLGGLGRTMAGDLIRRKIIRAFQWRHAVTKADLELATRYGRIEPRTILVAGASGLLGRALGPFLQTQGHRVVKLVRRPAVGADELQWDPARGELDGAKIEGIDAVVNLSGENVAGGRWTAARRERILRSRVAATDTLVSALGRLKRPPGVLVNASAIGCYGDRGAEILTEESGPGSGFLAGVVAAWEREALRAQSGGVRVVLPRFGVVLSPAGGALRAMLPAFRMGLGGPLGTGRQWMSWVAVDDAVGAIYHALVDVRCRGPINVVAPHAVTNAAFTAGLAGALDRPAFCRVPAGVLRMIFGAMAEETVLTSARVAPERLLASGYEFRQAQLEGALRHVLGRPGRMPADQGRKL